MPFSLIFGRVNPTLLGVGDSANKFGIKLKPIFKRNGLLFFTPDDLRLTTEVLRYALCRSLEVPMPAIASLEDLKTAQKEGVSIYAIRYALCSMLYGNGAALDGRTFASCGYRNAPQSN